MAGGTLGDVAVSSFESDGNHCDAGLLVMNGPGSSVIPPMVSYLAGACAAGVGPVAFDRLDQPLYGYEYQGSTVGGIANSGFTGEAVSKGFSGSTSMGPNVGVSFLGADAAGNLFVRAGSNGAPGSQVDYGLGPIAAGSTVTLHYNPAGALVSESLPATGTLAVGALGDLFYATSVTGTLDDGCGPVGAAGVASTVLTERSSTGACLWSRALPASTVFAVDPMQNVLLAATFSGTVDFGGGPLTSVGTSDLALAKLDPTGLLLWEERFGAGGASVSGVSSFGATNTGGAALSVGINGAVDFGCGAVTSSAGATTLIANFDAMGAVVYSRVVTLVAGGVHQAGPVVDGLGGVSLAVQVKPVVDCSCTTFGDPCPTPGDFCDFFLICESCANLAPYLPGNILVSRFAP